MSSVVEEQITLSTAQKTQIYIEEYKLNGCKLNSQQLDVLYTVLFQNKNIFLTGPAGKLIINCIYKKTFHINMSYPIIHQVVVNPLY